MQVLSSKSWRRPTLPRVCSTIGADGLNFSVRNGKRWNPDAITAIITLTYLYSFSLAFSTSYTLPARAPLSGAQVSGY